MCSRLEPELRLQVVLVSVLDRVLAVELQMIPLPDRGVALAQKRSSAGGVQMKLAGQVAEVEHTMKMIVVESVPPRLAECGLEPECMTGRPKGLQRL